MDAAEERYYDIVNYSPESLGSVSKGQNERRALPPNPPRRNTTSESNVI